VSTKKQLTSNWQSTDLQLWGSENFTPKMASICKLAVDFSTWFVKLVPENFPNRGGLGGGRALEVWCRARLRREGATESSGGRTGSGEAPLDPRPSGREEAGRKSASSHRL
jgi:hypothetical protein